MIFIRTFLCVVVSRSDGRVKSDLKKSDTDRIGYPSKKKSDRIGSDIRSESIRLENSDRIGLGRICLFSKQLINTIWTYFCEWREIINYGNMLLICFKLYIVLKLNKNMIQIHGVLLILQGDFKKWLEFSHIY